VERSAAGSLFSAIARRASGKVVLIVMIIGDDHIQLASDGVLCPGPEYLQDLVMSVKGGIDDIRVVDGGTAEAREHLLKYQ
jgi:hypothetical protein